jgi:hypothetical protein
MSQNEDSEEEYEGTEYLSEDEIQEDENLINQEEDSEESDNEPQETFVQKLRRENKEMKRKLKATPKESQKLDQNFEMRLFFIENPEYKEDKDGIIEMMEKHPTLTPEEAHVQYLSKKPKQSETRKEAFKGGSYKPKPKSLGEMTDQEAIEKVTNPKDWISYLRQSGQLK